ncbi:ASCH domain-containing protein [Entomospira culicis]|uniref:ASCH domain-containing protein n=1 Tax=Entomospira culicis TaxID=2719989 RepID=A0A968GGT8_9SPIO|nr:ASCH domain-containing protein [Entomospira culicis]NIZ19524.1 ASCH domain-containing protein [Entomospira culicis]NIZ69571.1 ASCH domain-containing protein [Entomospira culicis]WDI38311.1 ASCH domain-containing protein [Entomospira culicis]
MKECQETANIVLSIKPQYASLILSGEKRYEYRKSIPKKKIARVYIYVTSPIKKIVGYFTVEEIIYKHVDDLWQETSATAGISQHDFYIYFKNRNHGYAFKIKKVFHLTKPRKLKSVAPQSFHYI